MIFEGKDARPHPISASAVIGISNIETGQVRLQMLVVH
jgi:hypothetical protein